MKNKEREEIKKANTVRVILNVPIEIDSKFKELGIKRGIPKSAMILYAMSWYLDYSSNVDILPRIVELIKSVDEKNN